MQSPFPIITTFLDQTSVVNLVSKFPSKTSLLSWETHESCIIMDCTEMHHCTTLHCTLPLHSTALDHCTVPLHCTTALYHSTVPLNDHTLPVHCTTALYHWTTTLNHHTVPLHSTTALCNWLTNERSWTDHVIWGPMRGLAKKFENGYQTHRQTHRQADRHRDYLTESAQWADSVKRLFYILFQGEK